MSKEIKEEVKKEHLWDVMDTKKHDLTPKVIPSGVDPELFGLDIKKANEMTIGLKQIRAERDVLSDAYLDVIDLEITTENLPTFKELRLKIRDNRTKGLDKWKKAEKDVFLCGGRFVDSVYNKEVLINQNMESKLLEAEKFFENQEKEKKRIINLERIEKIRPYVEDVTGLDFSEMEDYDFDDYVLGKKTRFESEQKARIEAQKKAEAERLAEIERQKAIEIENAKLKIEAEKQAKELELERKKQAEILAKQKAESDRLAKIEAEKQAKLLAEKKKLESEILARQKAEKKAEAERLDKIEKERLKAIELEKAPIKEQLSIWVNCFEIPLPKEANETTLEIARKFNSFKKWAQEEINKL
tara:strand:- start:9361 stop:10434 length:1074 start_codon:yes stop_codon:yes gene_type:complete